MAEKKYIEDPKDIRLNENRELQQILGNPPGWLLRWGITFVALGVLVFLALGYLVKYPDIIPARVVLTTEQPPIRVFAEAAGKLSELRVKDQQEIEKGNVLAVLDNPADLEDVLALDKFILEIQENYSDPEIAKIKIPRNLNLGGLQTNYADFSKSFDEHIFFLRNNNSFSKISNLENQIVKLEELDQSLKGQIETLQKVVDLSQKEIDRNIELKKIGGVSESEIEAAETAYLRNKRQIETIDNEILTNNLQVERTRMQILEIKQQYAEGKSSGVFSIQEDIQKIRSEINNWKEVFLIEAPMSGQVSLTKFQTAQQFINQNEELLTIVPTNRNEIIAKGVLSARGSGKVEKNMRVNIRLDGYSYQEFGSIPCTVRSISLVPQKEGFIVELSIPQPLTTTYDKTIPFQQEMQGTANIITEDRRILDRIFDRILSILKND